MARAASTAHARDHRGCVLSGREARVRGQPLRLRPRGWTSDGRPALSGLGSQRTHEGPHRRRSDDRASATPGASDDRQGLGLLRANAHQSTAGDQVFARALAGKPARVLGDPDTPHTVTYIEDFARALATLGQREEALGAVWHVPNAETVTMRRFVEMVFEAARPRAPRLRTAPTMGSRARRPVRPHHPGGSGSSYTNPSARGWSTAAGSSGPSAGAPHRCPRRSGPPRRGSEGDSQPPKQRGPHGGLMEPPGVSARRASRAATTRPARQPGARP